VIHQYGLRLDEGQPCGAGNPGTSITPSFSGGAVSYGTAGVISSIANTPRGLQLAMKFSF
jgi:hypothetical protein